MQRSKVYIRSALLVLDFVSDIRRLAGVKLFKKEYDAYPEQVKEKEIENLKLPSDFQLQFFDETTKDFLNLVKAVASELDESSEDDEIYFN